MPESPNLIPAAITPPLSVECQGDLHPLAEKGILLFNQGQYWHAHEALEAAWLEETGPIRELYRGILQVGVTYLHVERGNYPGALKVYRRSLRWLDPFPEICRGVNLAQFRLDLENVIAEVQRLGPDHLAEFDRSLLKPVIRASSPQKP